MALPLDNRTIGDISSMTIDYRIPELIDNTFKSNPLLVRLLARNQVLVDGGDRVRQPILYDKLNSGWYTGADTFNTDVKNTETDLIFDWAQHYVNITLTGLDLMRNAGAAKIRDVTTSKMNTAKLTAADDFGTALMGDGSAFGGKVFTGLRAAVDDGTSFGAYGGITRDTSAQGTAVKGNVDSVGGAFSLPLMNTDFGLAVIANAKPDLVVTTQTIWNRWWERTQPSQRFGSEDIKEVGMDVIRFNGADVVVDSHVPASTVYFLNTTYIRLILHTQRVFAFTGWKYPTNADQMIGQLLSMTVLVVQGPRLQAIALNIT